MPTVFPSDTTKPNNLTNQSRQVNPTAQCVFFLEVSLHSQAAAHTVCNLLLLAPPPNNHGEVMRDGVELGLW
jgi:hypothetical protein